MLIKKIFVILLGFRIAVVSGIMRIFNIFETADIKNIGSHPRLHLYGTFNLWREYCGISWRTAKRLRSFEIFVLIAYHVRVIDDFVDEWLRPQGIPVDNQRLKEASKKLVSLLRGKIESLPIPSRARADIIRTFQYYRREVMRGFVLEGLDGERASLEAVLCQRRAITGTVYITLIRTLNIIHGIPSEKADRIERMFSAWGLSLQVADDVLDFSRDIGKIQNEAVAIARKYPEELAAWIVAGKPIHKRLRRVAPSIHKELTEVLQRYWTEIYVIDPSHPVGRIMVALSSLIFRSVLSRVPEYLYHFCL